MNEESVDNVFAPNPEEDFPLNPQVAGITHEQRLILSQLETFVSPVTIERGEEGSGILESDWLFAGVTQSGEVRVMSIDGSMTKNIPTEKFIALNTLEINLNELEKNERITTEVRELLQQLQCFVSKVKVKRDGGEIETDWLYAGVTADGHIRVMSADGSMTKNIEPNKFLMLNT